MMVVLLQDGQDATALLHKLNDLAAQRAEELEHMKAAEQKAALALQNDAFHQKEQQYHAMKLEIEKAEGELKSLDAVLSGGTFSGTLYQCDCDDQSGRLSESPEFLSENARLYRADSRSWSRSAAFL